MATRASITKLQLFHFRNYEQLSLESAAPMVILHGVNGAGKTNILEALSFLSPGRGMRRATLSHADSQITNQPWTIAADVEIDGSAHTIGTARDSAAAGEKRLVKIDGKPAKAQTDLSKLLSVMWLIPSMDQLFTEAESVRRRFIDRLTYAFSPQHVTCVNAYEKAMRERNALLQEGRTEAAWYDALEMQMAEKAVQIALARRDMIARVNEAIQLSDNGFPKALLSLEGSVEQLVASEEEAAVINSWRERLASDRRLDAVAGRTRDGTHKTSFLVTHDMKRMPASYCSTGEQKALLLSIMLGHGRARRDAMGQAPILLLDEVVAHLDHQRRQQLFDALHEMGSQAWLTGTDAADFSAAPDGALRLRVEDGRCA